MENRCEDLRERGEKKKTKGKTNLKQGTAHLPILWSLLRRERIRGRP